MSSQNHYSALSTQPANALLGRLHGRFLGRLRETPGQLQEWFPA